MPEVDVFSGNRDSAVTMKVKKLTVNVFKFVMLTLDADAGNRDDVTQALFGHLSA